MLTEQDQQVLQEQVVNEARVYDHLMTPEYFLVKVIGASMTMLDEPEQTLVIENNSHRQELFHHLSEILSGAAEQVEPGTVLDELDESTVFEPAFRHWLFNKSTY